MFKEWSQPGQTRLYKHKMSNNEIKLIREAFSL